VLACVALGHDRAISGAQQPRERRAAQIDDEIPAPVGDGAIKWQPMPGPALLFHDGKPLEPRHGFE